MRRPESLKVLGFWNLQFSTYPPAPAGFTQKLTFVRQITPTMPTRGYNLQ